MEVKLYQHITEERVAGPYNRLVESFDLLYSTYEVEWLIFLEKLLGERARLLSVEESGRMVGCLAFFTRESEGIRVANSLPYTQASFGGPLVRPDLSKEEGSKVSAAVLEAFLDLGRSEEWAAFAIKVGPPLEGYRHWSIPRDSLIERDILFTDLLNRRPLSGKIRWDVRKALKNGIGVRSICDEDMLRAFFNIYGEDMREKGTWSRDRRFFDLLLAELIPAGKVLFISALNASGSVVGGIIFCLGRGIADYAVQSTSIEGKRLQANSLLISRAMEILSEKGVRIWNWLASPNEGVHHFKKKWSTSEGKMSVYWKMVDREKFRDLKSKGREWIEEHFRWYYAIPYELLG